MAGFYPDVPAYRFALDLDGTVFKKLDAAKTVLSDAQAAAPLIADTDSDVYTLLSGNPGSTGTYGYFVLVFPELRNIDAMFIGISGYGADSKQLEYSSDTTDGLDGTWSLYTSNFPSYTAISPNYRSNITATPMANVKSLRFGYGVSITSSVNVFSFQCIHLYGNIVTGQNQDRLIFWHGTLDQAAEPAFFDFGDVPVGSQQTKQFRIKNNSSTLTANDVTLTRDSSYAEVVNGLTFSADGTSYFTTINIGALAPGALSPLLYVKRIFDAAETTSVPKDGRIVAAASSWS